MIKGALLLDGLVQNRISHKIWEIKREFGKTIINLLAETNQTYLQGKGKVLQQPIVDRNFLRWTLAWGQGRVSFDLNIVVSVEDDGRQARVAKVLVHRHASAPFNFDGHVPTTRSRYLTELSIAELRKVVESEFPESES